MLELLLRPSSLSLRSDEMISFIKRVTDARLCVQDEACKSAEQEDAHPDDGTAATPEQIRARVLRSGAVPAFGQGLALPQFSADDMRRLTPVASPAAAGAGRARARGDGDDAPNAATPGTKSPSLSFPPHLGERQGSQGGESESPNAATPELGPPKPRLKPTSGMRNTPRQSPLDEGGLNELQQMLARRRNRSGEDQ